MSPYASSCRCHQINITQDMAESLDYMKVDLSIVTPQNQIDRINNSWWYNNDLSQNPISVDNRYTTPKVEETSHVEDLNKAIINIQVSVDFPISIKNKHLNEDSCK